MQILGKEVVIFDIETDDLNATKLHCLVTSRGEEITTLAGAKKFLEEDGIIKVGHNIMLFDTPTLEKLTGGKRSGLWVDTLPLSWYINHERKKGTHGLEHYGDTFGVEKPKITDWKGLTVEQYLHRCRRDVQINTLLFEQQIKRIKLLYGEDESEWLRILQYLTFKMDCIHEQEKLGWRIDVEESKKLLERLEDLIDPVKEQLKTVMPPVTILQTKKKPKNMYKKDGSLSSHGQKWVGMLGQQGLDRETTEEVKVVVGYNVPNPGSDIQVKNWLFSLGWKPKTFDFKRDKVSGAERQVPQIKDGDELCSSVLALKDKAPEIELLEELSILGHRQGFVKTLLDSVDTEGRVRATVHGLANTLRFRHKKPCVNIPKVEKAWGKEIRSLFLPPEGYESVGSDMVSLESTTKKHYIWPYDPEYVKEMSKPGFDEHLDLAKHAGVITQKEIDDYNNKIEEAVKKLKPIRSIYKPVNYSAVYGVGKAKLAKNIEKTVQEAKELLDLYWERNWAVKQLCKDLKPSLKVFTNGFMWIKNPVSGFWYSLRFEKDVFSTVNQGTAVFCFDTWVAFCRKEGIPVCAQFHDEIVSFTKDRKDTEAKIRNACKKLNEKLKLNVELDVDIKFGMNYSETH